MQPSLANLWVTAKSAHRHHPRRFLQPPTVLLAVWLMFLLPAAASAAFAAQPPEEALEAYLRAIYARDFGAAYGLIAQADRELKTKRDYLKENGAFSGAALDLTTLLAEFIRFEYSGINIKGQDNATVTFRATVPDGNAPVLRDLFMGFDQQSLKALSAGERAARGRQLRQLATAGELPLITGGEETWTLVREKGDWHVVLGWTAALDIHFDARTMAGLPWSFAPLQPNLRAMPGETLQTYFRVKNLADIPVTAKARHVFPTPQHADYLDIIYCFCYLQQTLAAGEEKLFAVVFRPSYETPDAIAGMHVRYEFFPLDAFPIEPGR
ncbi:MAG: cytochrome c oxidase assembly protein [Candidatus Tectomicrobia bacterium]|nr:cytochrome c oxidase assembly protein [Candidatus Tectomicrobia bacterium]